MMRIQGVQMNHSIYGENSVIFVACFSVGFKWPSRISASQEFSKKHIVRHTKPHTTFNMCKPVSQCLFPLINSKLYPSQKTHSNTRHLLYNADPTTLSNVPHTEHKKVNAKQLYATWENTIQHKTTRKDSHTRNRCSVHTFIYTITDTFPNIVCQPSREEMCYLLSGMGYILTYIIDIGLISTRCCLC